ncbi:MAG TPA: amino acid adenylation domain-containing protein [Methylomirabilota bacterium]|nr:amino acid adenylation domain-containing protein [Methylomirabilota bacterium]
MTAAEIVAHLRGLDVRLHADGERLRCSAPKGVLTEEMREQLSSRKGEILAWLREHEGAGPDATGREPLAFAQQRLWFMDQLSPGGFAYNITGGLRIAGRLNVEALERALGELVRRHEPLRTVFVAIDGQPVQVVNPVAEFRLPVLDLQSTPAAEREADGQRRMIQEGQRPFDLGRGPLFRAHLFRFGSEEHVLQLTIHHIVADGWSLGVLSKDLTLLYAAYAAGGHEPGPPPARYADVIRRQRRRLSGPAYEAQAAYWRERLTPPPTVLELPSDRPRPAIQTFDGAVETLVIPPETADALRRIGREHGVTLFMILLAAFDVLLHRYTGLDDITVGTPIANRTDVETEGVIGLFANTLVLRTDMSGDPTVRALLQRVRDASLEAYGAQDFPFERLVEMVQPVRDMSHSPLFQVMFILQNIPFEPVELAGLTLSYLEIRIGGAKTDLTLEVRERKEGLQVLLEYNTDLFEADRIRRLGGHFERLLAAFVGDTDQRVSRLPLLSAAEWRQIGTEWNATEAPIADGITSDIVEGEAARAPAAVAAAFEEQRIAYRDLNGAANRLAHHLRRQGVGPNVLVGVLVERSLDMLIAVLAVMKAGGAYVPLDPGYPADRLEFMLTDGRIPVIITQEALRARLDVPGEIRTICLDRDAALVAREPEENLSRSAAATDLAYVIYTSGSTGRPKGVQITHRSLVNLLSAFRGLVGAGPRDILVAVSTLSFDIAGLELFLPLVTGGQVVIAGRDVAADPAKLMGLLADSGATIVQATPATWRMLIEAGWESAPGLRLLCGGEVLPADLAARLRATGALVWNVYGPTETTIWSTVHHVEEVDTTVPIGRPIANTRTYVLDRAGEPVPIGVPGELHIGGAGIARGYLDRPELTAERFVADRFSPDPAARLYRTGDIVRYRGDGALEFLGRVDHQVKVRGFRIELGEIESVLGRHPGVAEAVVVAREDRPGERYLAGYLRAATGASPTVAELRAFIKGYLPDYMVPVTFTSLPSFPLTPNGKVDRRRLPEPDDRRAVSRAPFLAPHGRIEDSIAAAWREVLRLEQVGVDDNFFDLGGHSLLLVQVQAKLRSALDREIAIVEMFQYPTVRTMAGHLARSTAGAAVR